MGQQEASGKTEEAKTATGAVDSPWPGRRSLGPPHLHLRRHHGWQFERYHFVLKSGCKLEELQLETSARLRRALSLYAMVAARLLHLTYKARQEPEASCEPTVSREEWQVLWQRFCPGQPLPEQAPRLRQAVRWIARLGGFLGRKHDGEPGVKVLWRGLQTLQAMVIGFQLGKAAHGVQSSDE